MRKKGIHSLADKVDDDADSDISDDDAGPEWHGEGLHEGKHARLLFLRSLDHDGDGHVHEGFGEVHHSLPVRRDGQGCDGHVRILTENQKGGG